MAILVQEKEMTTTAHMKTIDGDYCDGYYGWKGVKRAAVFARESQSLRTIAGRGGAATRW
jgi:hypothetical protein